MKKLINKPEDFARETIEGIVFGMNMPKSRDIQAKFHCRRQSGMNFGYVTVNEVNSSNISIFHVQHKNRKKYSF